MTFQKRIPSILKSYPVPQVNLRVVDFALAKALQPRLNVWPLLIGSLVALLGFAGMFEQVLLEYASSVFSMGYYVSLLFTLVTTAAVTLFKLFLAYGVWMLLGSSSLIVAEVLLNRRRLFPISQSL